MKKNLLALSLIFSIALAFLNSCGDDPADPVIAKKMSDYFPASVGSWWAYSNYETDSIGNKISSPTYDTLKVLSVETIAGKLAILMANYGTDEDGGYYMDTTIFSVDDSKLYMYLDTSFYNDDDESKSWLTFLVLGASQWDIMSASQEEVEQIDTLEYKTTYSMALTGKSGSPANVTVKGKSISGMGFFLNTYIKMTMSVMGMELMKIESNAPNKLWLANGIGLIKEQSSYVNEDTGDATYYEKTLIDYSIK